MIINSLPKWLQFRRGGSLNGKVCHVYSKAGGLGDELMVLSAIQAAVRKAPRMDIVYYSRHYALITGAEGPRQVRPLDLGQINASMIAVTYFAKHRLPIHKQMAKQLGVEEADDFTLNLPEKPLQLPIEWPKKDKIVIVVQTSASEWTPNKQWPYEHWLQLIQKLLPANFVFEVGGQPSPLPQLQHPHWKSFAGLTSLEEYISCIRSASLFIGPISSGMHLAHAYGIPSIIIGGGWEETNFPYPSAYQLGSSLSCSPCWLRTPCPFNRQCLREITPEMVLSKVLAKISPFFSRSL